jgi:hypothetical protein
MQSFGQTGGAMPYSASMLLLAVTFLFPASVMAMSLGNFMIGEEGQAVWRVYASPISAESLVKSKYFFIIMFALIILAVTGFVGYLIYHPSLFATIVACFETVFLVFALGAISLSNGIRGADFTETPRARMIHQSWSLINLVACSVAGLAVLAPFFPYVLFSTVSSFFPGLTGGVFLEPLFAAVISAVIAVVFTVVFYRMALNNARQLLKKAEI